MLICPLCSAALGEVDNGVACPPGTASTAPARAT